MRRIRKIPLAVYIIAALLPFIIINVGIIISTIYSRPYKYFADDFQQNAYYETDDNCMYAEYNGIRTKITPHNAEHIYKEIIRGGLRNYIEDAPTGDYIYLEFANGNSTKVWQKDSTGVIVEYIPLEGEGVIYGTRGGCRFINLERLISEAWRNEVVEQ